MSIRVLIFMLTFSFILGCGRSRPLPQPTPEPTPSPEPSPEPTPNPTDESNVDTPIQLDDEQGNAGLAAWFGILVPGFIGLVILFIIALIVRWIRK